MNTWETCALSEFCITKDEKSSYCATCTCYEPDKIIISVDLKAVHRYLVQNESLNVVEKNYGSIAIATALEKLYGITTKINYLVKH